MRATRAGILIALLVGAAAPAAALAGGPSVRGPSGVGDPFFPKAGNGYYDVQRYDLRLRYAPGTGKLRARALIRAVVDTPDPPGAALRRFNLDYRGPRITSLRVNGRRARHRRSGRELIVKPRRPLADGSAFLVVVRYRGRPRPVFDPDGSQEGWTRTADGAVALGEPRGSPSWFPANDHPTDKARFKIRITVPRPALGISNGALVRRKRRSGRVTTVWRQREPMATYLALVAIGRYRLDRRTVAGQPYLAAADRRYGRGVLKTLRKRTRLAHLLMEDVAGAYPATATGGVIDPSGVGYALETQGRPYYPRPPSRDLVVHEIAHGWYGNSVSPADWSEIWLNEGFATYMEWLDSERSGGQTAAERFDDLYATPSASNAFWNPPPAAVPGPAKLFDDTVYVRGAMALQVLRELVGKADFDQILADWATANAGGTVTTDDLRELIAGVTWSPVPPLFDEWLEQPGKPDPPP